MIYRMKIFNEPMAESVPAANNNESPGRNGVITKPVSRKIIINSMIYVRVPRRSIISTKYSSMCRMKSMIKEKTFIVII